MTTRIYYREVKRFLKENIKLIFLVSIIGSVLFGVFLKFSMETSEDEHLPDSVAEEINDTSIRYAQFRIYVESPYDTVFINNNLLENILLTESNIKEIEQKTGLEIQPILEEQILNEFFPTLTNRGALGLGRDPMTDTLVFQAKIGTEEQRLQTAEYFFGIIESDQIELLSDKKVTIIEEPHLHEYTPAEILEAETVSPTKIDNSLMFILIEILLALFVGVVIGIVFAAFYHIYTKKINYAFNYYVGKEDLLIIERKILNDFLFAVVEPNIGNKLLVSEKKLPNKLLEELNEHAIDSATFIEVCNVLEVDPEENISEVVVLIIEGETNKSWYNDQREFIKRLNKNVKVVQTSQNIVN
ncbi:hypothetical protein BW721_05750 [Jeotgalibaca sp. PTS2502]|uniref:hypothetical protein n=1 Tax=Jeotgalibaca sp. PTS2502 TaxID=1903686 RepID=UPI0009737911|nr:hypothetical protein [Jeotgalibaca sp. PTS2502]APZ49221.1 hypothetical protein BW721_05750 [Jeotgalibaca sp. PTS2502]